jgi:hypothetical protein
MNLQVFTTKRRMSKDGTSRAASNSPAGHGAIARVVLQGRLGASASTVGSGPPSNSSTTAYGRSVCAVPENDVDCLSFNRTAVTNYDKFFRQIADKPRLHIPLCYTILFNYIAHTDACSFRKNMSGTLPDK